MKSIFFLFSVLFVSFFANAAAGYVCVSGDLYKPNGSKEFVGSSACANAKLGNGYACVNGSLYLPNSTQIFVGSSDCANANFGN